MNNNITTSMIISILFAYACTIYGASSIQSSSVLPDLSGYQANFFESSEESGAININIADVNFKERSIAYALGWLQNECRNNLADKRVEFMLLLRDQRVSTNTAPVLLTSNCLSRILENKDTGYSKGNLSFIASKISLASILNVIRLEHDFSYLVRVSNDAVLIIVGPCELIMQSHCRKSYIVAQQNIDNFESSSFPDRFPIGGIKCYAYTNRLFSVIDEKNSAVFILAEMLGAEVKKKD